MANRATIRVLGALLAATAMATSQGASATASDVGRSIPSIHEQLVPTKQLTRRENWDNLAMHNLLDVDIHVYCGGQQTFIPRGHWRDVAGSHRTENPLEVYEANAPRPILLAVISEKQYNVSRGAISPEFRVSAESFTKTGQRTKQQTRWVRADFHADVKWDTGLNVTYFFHRSWTNIDRLEMWKEPPAALAG